jgi:hypothetical protein
VEQAFCLFGFAWKNAQAELPVATVCIMLAPLSEFSALTGKKNGCGIQHRGTGIPAVPVF